MRRGPFIALAGNIASGKSSILEPLATALGLAAWPERWRENPWFEPELGSPLARQLWFLLAAAKDQIHLLSEGGVLERCIHEHALVFAAELLSGDERGLARDVYLTFDELLGSPDMILFFDASPEALLRRIRARGRPQEASLDVEYLGRLDHRYRRWLDQWTRCPVVTIDTERMDVRIPETIDYVVERVKEALS